MAQHRDQMNELILRVFQQAPQTLHHVFALDGANATMASLKNAETKVAYLIQMIALQLHKASKELRNTKPSDGPNDLRFHLMRTHPFFASQPFIITISDLGYFEDLYYATCAKLKELLQGVDLLLANGFRLPEDTYFVYEHYERLKQLDGISVGDFKAHLLTYERILYSTELTELLNRGIMKQSMCYHDYDGQEQVHINNDVDVQTVRRDIGKQSEKDIRRGVLQQSLGRLREIRELQDTSNMGCSMIFGNLAEKYRLTVLAAESEGDPINREPTPDAPQAVQDEQLNLAYVSPYNLEERAKKLNVPGGPEMPCLCDPDCICVPVCASDPTQNCLCEENGLFTCVTQGMDIDDLDVPDLVRRKSQSSDGSGSSAASLIASTGASPNELLQPTHYGAPDGRFSHHYGTMDEVEQQKQEQRNIVSNEREIEDMAPTSDTPGFAEAGDNHFWQGYNSTPLRASSLLYRDALTQPFSKQCEYPPKRSSMAQRLFSSRNSGIASNKRAPIYKQVIKGHAASASTRKTFKQADKRIAGPYVLHRLEACFASRSTNGRSAHKRLDKMLFISIDGGLVIGIVLVQCIGEVDLQGPRAMPVRVSGRL